MFEKRWCFALFAVLSLLLASCDEPNEAFVSNDAIIKLQAVSNLTNLSADGNTIIQFKAVIPKGNASEIRDIIFTLSDANLGKFMGTSTTNKLTVRANSDGEAIASVKVGVIPGDYFISAEISIAGSTYRSSDISVKLKPITASDKIQLVADNLTPVANGNSLITLSVTSTFSQDKKATLTSNMGSFVNSTDPKSVSLTLDDQGRASVLYRVSNEVVANIITAKLTEGAQATLIINPLVSYTDTVLVDPSALRVDTTGGFIQFTSLLKKFNPSLKVSKGQPAFVAAYQVINGVQRTVGRFTGATAAVSDAEGNVPAIKFFADTGNINPRVPITIEVSAFKTVTDKTRAKLTVTVR